MSDPERLTRTGTDDERRLLRAAQTTRVPASIETQVRRAVETRMHGGQAKRRWWIAASGLLIAGAAAASGAHIWRTPVVAPVATMSQSPPPKPAEPPAPVPVPPAAVKATPVRRTSKAPHTPGLGGPGLQLRDLAAAEPHPAPAPVAHLVIARSDRASVSLEVGSGHVRGNVRGRAIALDLGPRDITGRIGDDQVSIHLFGLRRAEGTVGGRPVDFTFKPTERGWIVEASLPDVGGQVDLDDARIAFHPGCTNELPAVAGHPGRYDGTCSDGTHVQLDLPTFEPLIRLVVLGMLLPEPDPILRGQLPGLFPPP